MHMFDDCFLHACMDYQCGDAGASRYGPNTQYNIIHCFKSCGHRLPGDPHGLTHQVCNSQTHEPWVPDAVHTLKGTEKCAGVDCHLVVETVGIACRAIPTDSMMRSGCCLVRGQQIQGLWLKPEYIHTYIHAYIHTLHKYIHTYKHTYIRTYAHTYIHTCITCITYIHTYTHTYLHTYMHA